MRKLVIVFATAFLCFAHQAFADDDMTSSSCTNIAKACTDAGFVRNAMRNGDTTTPPNKMFWRDCMWPVLLGKTVEGVTVDAQDVMTCRSDKINKMEDELKQLQQLVTPPNPPKP